MSHAAALSPVPRRASSSPDFRRLWRGEAPDKFAQAEEDFAKWINHLATVEVVYKRFIYDNEAPTQLDFRLHRQNLYASLAWGEEIAIELECLEEADETRRAEAANYVRLIDQKLGVLRDTLREWHGHPEEDAAIPESFKIGLHEAVERVGLEDFPTNEAARWNLWGSLSAF